jgi:hypothetical protein
LWYVVSCVNYYRSRQLIVTPGNIIRQAEQVGVPVPTVRMVYHTLIEMNRQMQEATHPM